MSALGTGVAEGDVVCLKSSRDRDNSPRCTEGLVAPPTSVSSKETSIDLATMALRRGRGELCLSRDADAASSIAMVTESSSSSSSLACLRERSWHQLLRRGGTLSLCRLTKFWVERAPSVRLF